MAFEIGNDVTVTEKLAVNGYPHLYEELTDHVGTVSGVSVYGPADNERLVTVQFPTSKFAPRSGYEFSVDEIELRCSCVGINEKPECNHGS